MRVCVMASVFPKRSETFILEHVTGLLRTDIEVHVIANCAEESVWSSLGEFEEPLRRRTFLYNIPSNKVKRFKKALGLIGKNLREARYGYLDSYNFIRYPHRALSLTYPHLLQTVLDNGKLEILHCHFGVNGIYGAYLKKAGLVDKLIVTFHGYDITSKTINNEHMYKEVFKYADKILPVSDRWRKKLLELGAPSDRVEVHRLGVDVNKFKFKKRRDKQDKIKLVTTARLMEKKGLEYAIKAVHLLSVEQPNFPIEYQIIGDGPLYLTIKKLVEQYKIQDRVILHGALPHAKVQEILAESDIFMLPSVTAFDGDQEGIPIVLMEAMASGLPVISTWHSGIPELVKDGVSGILTPERDYQKLAESIAHLCENFPYRLLLAKNGRETVERYYNSAKQQHSLIEIYESL